MFVDCMSAAGMLILSLFLEDFPNFICRLPLLLKSNVAREILCGDNTLTVCDKKPCSTSEWKEISGSGIFAGEALFMVIKQGLLAGRLDLLFGAEIVSGSSLDIISWDGCSSKEPRSSSLGWWSLTLRVVCRRKVSAR